jgi:predicted phage baseplate assembly protein
MVFLPTYRVGNGPAGNVGAGAITRVVLARGAGATLGVRNPLPATGGTDPESADVVRQLAPFTFRTNPERAVLPDDYARLAQKYPDPTRPQKTPKVHAAAATRRWLGSWYEVIVAIHPHAVPEDVPTLPDDVAAYLEPYRRIGHDLVVRFADYVPLVVTLDVCVQPQFFRGHVEAALRDVFSNRDLPDGSRGFFHPDNLTFGQNVPFSKLVAVAQGVEGVWSVTVNAQRLFAVPGGEPVDDVLVLGPLEVPRVDGDPSRPGNGQLIFNMRGGR